MSTDGEYIAKVAELVSEINACLRRGFLVGPIAEQINITIRDIGGTTNFPLSLRRVPKGFAVPRNFDLHTGALIMATINIRGDVGTRVPVEFDNLAGTAVPDPTGDATVTSSNDAIASVTLDTDGHSVLIRPAQPPTDSTPFTLTYTDGSITFTGEFAISPDVTAVAGHFVDSAMTTFPLDGSQPTV